MWEPPVEHPLRRLFAGLAEHAFLSHLGVADPPLIDYLSTMLSRFVHTDGVYRLRSTAGQPLVELADMVIEAEQLPQSRPIVITARLIIEHHIVTHGQAHEEVASRGGK